MTGKIFGRSFLILIIADNFIFINLITNDRNYGRIQGDPKRLWIVIFF